MSVHIYGEPGVVKGYVASAEVNPNRFVKFGATEGSYLQAAAASDAICGASAPDRIVGIDGVGDVIHTEIGAVQAGGNITRGTLLTSDANGKAIAASSGNRIGGMALRSAVLDDVFPVLLMQGVM